MDPAAAQVPHRREREGGGEEVWSRRRLVWGKRCEIHPPLVSRGRSGAGGRRRPPELALEDVDFIHQLGELVEGGDGAPSGNTGFRNPAQEEELPNDHVGGHEQREEEPPRVGGPAEPVPEEALRRALVFHWGEIGFELRRQGAAPGQRVLGASQPVPLGRGRRPQGGTGELLPKRQQTSASVSEESKPVYGSDVTKGNVFGCSETQTVNIRDITSTQTLIKRLG